VRRIVAGLLVALVGCLICAPTFADEPPVSQQALLLLRILAYDRGLKARTGGQKVVVAVAYRAGDKSSEDARSKVVRSLEDVAGETTVLGMKVAITSIAVDGSLDDKVNGAHPAALYICPGLDDAIGPISQVTRRRSVLSLAPRPEPARNGLAVGFDVRDARTVVIVNLAAARAEGVDFESAFLRVAEVIK